MPRTVVYTFVALDKFSNVAERINTKVNALRGSLKKFNNDLRQLNISWKDIGNKITGFGKKMSFVSAGIGALAASTVIAAAKNEQLAMSYRILVGDADKANKLLKDIYEFAAKTPFNAEEIVETGRQLIAFKIPVENIMTDLAMLGDIAAGVGKPIGQLAFVYGQMMDIGFLQGGDAMQFANAGINVRRLIADKFGMDMKDVYKAIETKQVPAALVRDLLIESSKTTFKNMMGELSKTTAGKWSNVVDNIDKAKISLGQVLIEELKINDALDTLLGYLDGVGDKIKAWSAAHPVLSKIAGYFVVFAVVLGPILIVLGQMVIAFGVLSAIGAAIGVSLGAITAGIVGTIAGFAALLYAMYVALDVWDAIWNKMKSIVSWITGKVAELTPKITSWLDFTNWFSGKIETNNNISANVDINLNAPKGVVNRVGATASPGLNLGVNMAGAR